MFTQAAPSTARLHLLMVEDDRSIRDSLVRYLAGNDVRVTEAVDAKAARRLLSAASYDLILLDIMMPGESGLSLCRHIRETLDLPIIILTARSDETERILGLEMGADDYVAKPFNPRELLARIQGVVRRTNAVPPSLRMSGIDTLAFGPWTLKLGQRELVDKSGVATPLSSGEFSLLRTFVERPKRVLTREQLLELTRGSSNVDIFDRSIDNQVSRLRKKIEINPADPQFIKTVRGGGYMFCADIRKL